MKKIVFSTLLCGVLLYAQSVDEDWAGFDDIPEETAQTQTTKTPQESDTASAHDTKSSTADEMMEGFDDAPAKSADNRHDTEAIESDQNMSSDSSSQSKEALIAGLTGEFTQQLAYSWNGKTPHDGINSFKSSLFLDYEHKFDNGIKIKANTKAYYDSIYSLKSREDFTTQELDELESEIELFDAYIEGKITDNLDYKIGRQVVVWGRSDTIRVTDILNPIDNRRPGMTDIEDLRLPVTMAKFDYFLGDWRITPIAILEQRLSKMPPFGSAMNPSPLERPDDESYSDVTYALSVGAEFSGWDVNFYAANTHDDAGYLDMSSNPLIKHEKVNMLGSALNILSGSWLFKGELAYFDGLRYATTGEREFNRYDLLLGVEYNGIADTMISYDIVTRNIQDYDGRLLAESNPLQKHQYQQALRISSDFLNNTLTANYLISLYGKKLNEGGFQRLWFKYEIADGINTNFGIVDYRGGSLLFDAVKDNDMVFVDVSYSF